MRNVRRYKLVACFPNGKEIVLRDERTRKQIDILMSRYKAWDLYPGQQYTLCMVEYTVDMDKPFIDR